MIKISSPIRHSISTLRTLQDVVAIWSPIAVVRHPANEQGNWLLITGELVDFHKEKLVEVQEFKKLTHHFGGTYGLHLKIGKKQPKNHNMSPDGLGNTGILTDYAQKSPRTLHSATSLYFIIPKLQIKKILLTFK